MLLHAVRLASHLHSSVQVTLFALQEHLPEHLLATQPHFTSSTTDSGAGGMSDTMGEYVPSSVSCHPRHTGSKTFGCGTVSCAQTFAW